MTDVARTSLILPVPRPSGLPRKSLDATITAVTAANFPPSVIYYDTSVRSLEYPTNLSVTVVVQSSRGRRHAMDT